MLSAAIFHYVYNGVNPLKALFSITFVSATLDATLGHNSL